jgi:hypothetical protein
MLQLKLWWIVVVFVPLSVAMASVCFGACITWLYCYRSSFMPTGFGEVIVGVCGMVIFFGTLYLAIQLQLRLCLKPDSESIKSVEANDGAN